MDLLIQKIEGKPITRFPVYLEKKGEPRNVQVAAHLNDVARLMKDGSTWINRGVAPYDRNRAVLNSKPSSNIVVSKPFEVFRVTEVVSSNKHTDRGYYEKGMTLHLFPRAKFSPSSAWLMANRPRAGGYILRHDNDYYTYVSDKLFDRQYGSHLDAETLEKFKNCMPSPKKQEKAPVAKVEEDAAKDCSVAAALMCDISVSEAANDETEDAVVQTTSEIEDIVSEEVVDNVDVVCTEVEEAPGVTGN